MSAPYRDELHLSIGEVLTNLHDEFPDVTVSKIRFLESQGLIEPERTPSGYRRFYGSDLDRLRWILYQQREHFLPLRVIKERLDRFGPVGAPPLEPAAGERPPVPDDLAIPPRPVTRLTNTLTLPLAAPHPEPDAAGERDTDDDDDDPDNDDDDVPPAARLPDAAPAARTDDAAPDADRSEGVATRPRLTDVSAVPAPAPLPAGTLTRHELVSESGLGDAALEELESYGLIVHDGGPGETARYDEEALEVARAAAPFYARGITARHLRMYQHFADREAELLVQVVLPYRKQRNPVAAARRDAEFEELTRAGARLRSLMLRRVLRDQRPE